MDFDNLGDKLRRVYRRLGATYDFDIGNNINDTRQMLPSGIIEHRVSFGNSDPQVREDNVMNAIHAIASLKDIIKVSLKKSGHSQEEYEKVINENTCLQLVTDLDNMDKHGSKLTNRRFKESVSLVNIDQALRGKGITSVSFTTDLKTGKTRLDSSSGDVKIIITGEIINKDGDVIATLGDVLENSIKIIDKFITNKQLA